MANTAVERTDRGDPMLEGVAGHGRGRRWWARDQRAFDAFSERVEKPMLFLALAFVPVVVIPLTIDLPRPVEGGFHIASWGIWALFVLEFLVLVWLAPRRLRMIRTHWFDLVIIALPILRPLRASRGLRILRVPFAAGGLGRIAIVLRRVTSRRGVQTFIVVVGVSIVLGSAAVYGLEYDNPDSDFGSFADVVWWATFTATTIGRTEHYPSTVEGQIIAIGLMALRVSLLAMITAHMAAYFVEIDEQEDNEALLRRLDAIEAKLGSGGRAPTAGTDAAMLERLGHIERLLADLASSGPDRGVSPTGPPEPTIGTGDVVAVNRSR
jgi:voltage-gated potassium channel